MDEINHNSIKPASFGNEYIDSDTEDEKEALRVDEIAGETRENTRGYSSHPNDLSGRNARHIGASSHRRKADGSHSIRNKKTMHDM